MRLFEVLSPTPALRGIASLIPNPDRARGEVLAPLPSASRSTRTSSRRWTRRAGGSRSPARAQSSTRFTTERGSPTALPSQHNALCGALESHLKSSAGASPPPAAACLRAAWPPRSARITRTPSGAASAWAGLPCHGRGGLASPVADPKLAALRVARETIAPAAVGRISEKFP